MFQFEGLTTMIMSFICSEKRSRLHMYLEEVWKFAMQRCTQQFEALRFKWEFVGEKWLL